MESVYKAGMNGEGSNRVKFEVFHQLAVIFALCSFGTSLDMEAPPLEDKATQYLEWAQEALVAGRWMVYTTIPSMHALCLICKALPYANLEFRWDYTWQLSGSCMRMLLAMGLHRDGLLWGLSTVDSDIRRRIFWDWMTSNAFMSANWDRLPGISEDQYDTLLPESWVQPQRTFYAVHADLSTLATEALNDTHKLGSASFARSMDIFGKIQTLESEMPFNLRCRAAMLAMRSKYRSPNDAEAASPDAERDDMAQTMQQHYLVFTTYRAMHTCLHAYFVSALKDSPAEPTKSAYGAPFITMVERSTMVIATLESLHSLYPLVSLRHWHFWTHGFSAAMVLCVVLLVSPNSALAPLAHRNLDKVMALIPVLKSHLPREQIRKDIDWLARLHTRAKARANPSTPARDTDDALPGEEMRLLGWRTRFIGHRAKNVSSERDDHIEMPTEQFPFDTTMLSVDTSWWKEPIPPPLQTSDGGSGAMGQSVEEWFHSFFEA